MTQVETNISIRPLSGGDILLMETFLYEAIFVPEDVTKPPREIILQPELAIYVRGFGKCIGDHGVVAEINSEIVGMAWTRIMADYGHIDDATPSLAIAVLPEYRGRGIGTALLEQLLEQLRAAGYVAVSLSVQQKNPALHLYERLGFEPVRVADGEVVMRCAL